MEKGKQPEITPDRIILFRNGSQLLKGIGHKSKSKPIRLNKNIDPKTICIFSLEKKTKIIPFEIEYLPDIIHVKKGPDLYEGEFMSRNGSNIIMRIPMKRADNGGNVINLIEICNPEYFTIITEGKIQILFENSSRDLILSYVNPYIQWEAYHVANILSSDTISITTFAKIINKTGSLIRAKTSVFKNQYAPIDFDQAIKIPMLSNINDMKDVKGGSLDLEIDKITIDSDSQMDITKVDGINYSRVHYLFSNRESSALMYVLQPDKKFYPGKLFIYNPDNYLVNITKIEDTNSLLISTIDYISQYNLMYEKMDGSIDIVYKITNKSKDSVSIKYHLLLDKKFNFRIEKIVVKQGDDYVELTAREIIGDEEYSVINCEIPPHSSAPLQYKIKLDGPGAEEKKFI